MENVRDRPVLPSVETGYLQPLLPDKAPYLREPWAKIMPDIERFIMPGVSRFIQCVGAREFKKAVDQCARLLKCSSRVGASRMRLVDFGQVSSNLFASPSLHNETT